MPQQAGGERFAQITEKIWVICQTGEMVYSGDMKIVVIDGQGGSIGRAVVEQVLAGLERRRIEGADVVCIGTNAMATASMIKGGAKSVATGENPVVVACRDADWIVGPVGIAMADAMLGEITPVMARAVNDSAARKVLIPVNKCVFIPGTETLSLKEHIALAVEEILGSV